MSVPQGSLAILRAGPCGCRVDHQPVPRMKIEHKIKHATWLRAAVLGANDGIVSVACLLLTVAMAQAETSTILLTGVAGLVSGALSMAAGEYVSVCAQRDTERAALAEEQSELEKDFQSEVSELAKLYAGRGLRPAFAQKVAQQLMAHDALDAHAREELGINDYATARPVLAALSSALSFAFGAALPLLAVVVVPGGLLPQGVVVTSLCALVLLGAMSARAGGAPVGRSIVRIVCWSSAAMAVTAGIGHVLGVSL